MMSLFDDDPLFWEQNKIYKFMQSLNCQKKLLDTQNTIKMEGKDYIMKSEDELIRFYKASSIEEKNQLKEVRRQIINRNNQFNSAIESSGGENGGFAESRIMVVTGKYTNINSDMVDKKMDILENSNKDIEVEKEIEFKLYDLPYDPFDFDTPMNYESAKNDYENYLSEWNLYRQYLDFKSKKSINRKIETQLVLEIKRTNGTTETGSSTVEKLAIKENQQLTLGTQNCDWILRDKAVSRKHVLIENINGICSIQDLGSSCGTFIRIKSLQIPLKEGSIFECGFQEFQINSIQSSGDCARVKLTIYDGIEQYKGQSFDLNIQNRFLIGRDIRCHFGSQFQDDKDLCPYHAKLSIKDNVLSIMDLDSQKGTWLRLSPQKVESAKFQINNQSEIKINPFIITVKVNQMSDVQVNQSQNFSNGMCTQCKLVKANIQALPCQHVICCKSCYQKLNFKMCPRYDCNNPIKSVETLYNC